MNKRIIPAAIAVLCLYTGIASAQPSGRKNLTKDETVIIQKDKRDGRTVIEIKDGTVYINGDAIVTVHDADAAKVHKKIIIEDGGNGMQEFSFRNNHDEHEFLDEGGEDGPARGEHRPAMLGVMTDPKSEAIGAAVKGIMPGSAAEAAGLKEGDVITRVDGKTIKDPQQLVMEITAQHEPGDRVAINYERGGEERSTTAKLGSATSRATMRGFRSGPEDDGGAPGDMPNSFFRSRPFGMDNDAMALPAPKLGVSAEDRADGEGVRVLSVKPGSPAASAGLKEGDVITKFNGDKVNSVDWLQHGVAIASMERGRKVKLAFRRNGSEMTAEVVFPKEVKKRDL